MFSVTAIIARTNSKGEQVFQNDPTDSSRCLRATVDVKQNDDPHIFKLTEALCQALRYQNYEKEYFKYLLLVTRCRQVLPRPGSNDLLYIIDDSNESLENFSPLTETDSDLINWIKEAPHRIDGEKPSKLKGNYILFVNQIDTPFDYVTEAVYMSFLHKAAPLAAWNIYYPPRGELPTSDVLKQLDGVVLTGSRANLDEMDVYGHWVLPFIQILEQILANDKIKVMGVCFGHQIIAQTLGGTVSKREGGFVRGTETVQLSPALEALPAFKKFLAKGKSTFLISESHGREVSKLPPKATLGGISKTCGVEMYTVGDRVLCFQGHPEYSREYMALRGMILYKSSRAESEKFTESYVGNESEKILEVCVEFLFSN